MENCRFIGVLLGILWDPIGNLLRGTLNKRVQVIAFWKVSTLY